VVLGTAAARFGYWAVSLRPWRREGVETGPVDRRGFLLGAAGLLLAGCAKTQPGDGSQPTPSPSLSGPIFATESGAVGTMLGALLTGVASAGASVQALGTDWQTQVGKGTWSAAVVYATTAWDDLSDSDDPPGDDVQGQLAGLIQPDITELNPGETDGALIWMVPTAAGVTSLEELAVWSAGKVAAVPSWTLERADGLPGLNAIYQTSFTSVTEDDPIARAQALASGQVAIGAFRRTEYYGTTALLELADPEKLSTPDLVTLLVNSTFLDDQADLTEKALMVVQSLTTAELVAMQQQVATGAQIGDVAQAWLKARSLIK
jgi:hypothetical protein